MLNWRYITTAICALALTGCGGSSDRDPPPPKTESNTAPVANAGPDQTVQEASQVTLTAESSTDADGDALTYAWAQVGGEPSVTLSSATAVSPQFDLPELYTSTTLTFELTVTDGEASATDTVEVLVEADNDSPSVALGSDVTMAGGDILVLNAPDVTDAEGDEVTYSWSAESSQSLWFLNDDGTWATSLTEATGKLHIPAGLAGETITVSVEVNDGNSSSTDTMTVTVADCPGKPGYLFTDCIDPSLLGGVVWEQSRTENNDGTRDSIEYFDGNTDNHVRWAVVDLDDGIHNNVIDLTFNGENANGRFRFLPAGRIDNPGVSVDLSDYTDGRLVFDARVLGREQAFVYLSAECTWPCATTLTPIERSVGEEWTTISIPVQEFTDRGLDLSKADVPFQIAAEWDNQVGVHLQLDNIRYCDAGEGLVYEDCLSGVWPTFAAWDDLANENYTTGYSDNHITWAEIFSGDSERGHYVDIRFNQNTTGNIYTRYHTANAGEDMSEYLNGSLRFDLRAVDHGANTGGYVVRIDCVWPCTSDEVEVDAPPVGEWTSVEIPVAQFGTALDLSQVSTGFNIYPAGDQQSVHIQVDNIIWVK